MALEWMIDVTPDQQYREAMDYEFNAQYDRYDGWGDPDPSASMPYEPSEEELRALEEWQQDQWDDGTANSEWDRWGMNQIGVFSDWSYLNSEQIPF